MAPEQARGDEIDHRLDVYAAGVVLYQMLVGKVPFGGDTALGIITKHLTDTPVPPHVRVPELGVPKALEDIVQKAMSKDPGQRYQSAGEMADAIEVAVKSLGDDASARLGTGTFTAARTKRERREGESTAKTLIAPSTSATAPESSATRSMVIVGVVVIGLVALASWWSEGRTLVVEPTTVIAAPPTTTLAHPPPTIVPAPPTSVIVEPPPSSVVVAIEPPTTTTHVRPRPTSVTPPTTTTPIADVRTDGQRAFDEGRRMFLANDVPGAIAQFEVAARAMPTNADVQKQLGRAYMRAGDVQHSVAAYRRYLALSPDAADRAIIEGIIAQH